MLGIAHACQLKVEVQLFRDAFDTSCQPELQAALEIYQKLNDQQGEAWTLKMTAELYVSIFAFMHPCM